MSIYSAAILLFLVMDPLGNIPVFLTVLKDVPAAKRKKIIFRELVIALGVLVFFLFVGRYLLEVLELSEPSLSVAWKEISTSFCLFWNSRPHFTRPSGPLMSSNDPSAKCAGD